MSTIKKETRELGEFRRITVNGVGQIQLQQGNKQEVTIEAEEHVLSRVRTDVIDGNLLIDIGRDWLEKLTAGLDYLSTRGIVFHITVKDLDAMEVNGACKVVATGFKGKELKLQLNGASNVTMENINYDILKSDLPGAGRMVVSGKAGEQFISLAGAGSYMADELQSQKTRVSLSGVGSARLWVEDELDAAIAGVGTIEYYGEPDIKQSVAMMGTIRSLGKKP